MKRWGLFLVIAGCAAAYSIPGTQAVEALLRGALQTRYPDVVRWQIKPLSGTSDSPADVSMPPRIVQLGARSAVRVGSQSHWYSVAGFQPVLVATRRISAKEALALHDGKILEKNVLAAGCVPLADTASLEGARAKRSFVADQIICQEFIELRPAVSRGEQVTVHYVGERVALIAKGVAQADGAVGDSILVRNAGSPNPFRVRVSGPHEVTIHE
jgi:flagella basal body P-ring formation protein FlgA